MTANIAIAALSKVKMAMAQRGQTKASTMSKTIQQFSAPKNEKVTIPSDAILDERYDRMSRKDFSRKIVGNFPPTLVNDSYANFRFSKRAGEVLSPLSKSKFGFTARTQMRKLSNGQSV